MAKKKDENLTPEERAYQAALAKHFQELMKINKETERQKSFWDSIVFAITDVSESNFFVNIKRSPQDIARANARLEEMNVILKEVGENVNNSFEAALSTIGDISTAVNTDLRQDLTRLAGINAEMATDLTEALYQGDITKFFAKFGDEGRKAFNNIVKDKKGFEAIHQFLHEDAVKDFGKINDQVKKLIILSQEQDEQLFSWRKTLSYIGENIFRNFTPKNLLSIWNDFDQIINETQRNFGIAMDANAGKFTTLVTQNQIFGMGAKENAALMGQLGDELRSTNFDMLGKAALDMGAIHRATGLSVEEVGELGKQMMFFGRSSETVRDFTEETMQMALKYGLSSKKVLQEVTKALPDARKLGWAGGEKALRDMVLQSQKLGQTLEGLAAAAKKLRTLEGSLEAAADLALVGVNVNAIQMLGAARRGGKEFSSFISDITKSIGTIKDTGEVDFSPIDIDRLQVIADATGSTIEDLQNQIAKGAQRNRKLELLPPSLMGANLSDEEREFLLNAAQIGKNGKALDLNLGGIKDITKLTPELLRSNMAQKLTLEEAAKNNQSFNESLTNFSNTVKALFTYVQPIIEEATRWIQGLNNWVKELPESAKKMVGILTIGMGIFFVAAKHFFSGYWYGQGFNSAVNKGGFLSGFGKLLAKFNPANWMKSATTAAAPAAGPNLPTNYQPPSQGAIQNTSSFGEALKNFPKPGQLLALSVAIVALGAAFVGIGYGIKLAADGLASLVTAFDGISNAGAALGAVSVVMAGFVGMLALMIPVIGALGAASIAVWPGLLALGGVFVAMGFGIMLASNGISNLVKSFDGLSNSVSAVVAVGLLMGGFVGILYAMSPAIVALGAALATLGATGAISLPVLAGLALVGTSVGLAFLGIGFGIKMAAEGLAILVKSFDGASASISSVVSVGLMMGGVVAIMYAMTPAILALGGSLMVLGASGVVALPMMLALSGAMIAFGIGIKFASEGIAKLATTFSGLSSSVASVGLSLVTFVGVLYAMVPAISSLGIALAGLGLSGMVALPVMAGLGLAMAGIGYGFKLASEGIETIIKSLASVQTSITPLSTMVPALAAMTGILFALSPGLLLLGGSLGVVAVASALAIPGVIALGAAIIGIGAGINLASKGISELVSSFAQLNNSVGAIAAVGLTMAGFVAVLYASTPAIAALGVALAGLGVSGWVAIPTLLALGGAATLVGLGIKLAAEGIGFAVKSFKDLSSSIEKTTSSSPQLGTLSTSLAKFTPTVAGFGASGLASGPGIIAMAIAFGILAPAVSLLAPALEKISTLNLGNLSNIGDSLGSLAKGAIGIGAIGAILPLLASAALGLTLIKKPFENIIPVFNQLGTVDWSKIQSMGSALLSMIPGIFAFSALGLVSPLLTATSGGLLILGKALTYFSALNLSNLASLGDSLSQSISGIMKFAAVGLVSPALILASMALSNIGNALSSVKEFNMNALSNIGEVLESLVMPLIKFSAIGLFAGPITLASGVMIALGSSLNYFSSRIGDIANVNWSGLDQFSDSMSNMIPGLLKFAGLGLLMVPISAGIAMLGILGSTLPKFAQGLQILNTVDTSGLQSLSSKLLTSLPGLASLSLLGVIATPFAIGATVLAGGAKMLESASIGIGKFLSIPWEKFMNIEGPISQLTGSLLKFAVLSIIGVPILAGATMLAGAGVMLGEASKGFDKLSLVNWTGLGQMGSALNAMLPSFLKFSLIGLMSGPLIAGAAAVSLAGSLLGKSVDGFVKFGKVNFNAITNFGEIIPELMSSLGKLSLLSILAVPVIVGAEMLAIAGSAFGSAAKGFNQLSSVDWNSLQGVGENLTGLLGGLMKLAGVGIVAPLIVAAGLALSGVGLGLKTFSSLKFDGIENLGGLIENLVPGLIKFSIIGALMAPITLAAGAISILGGAFVSLSSGAKYLEKIDWSVLNSASDSLSSAIPAFLQLAGVGMVSLLVAAGAGVFMLVGKSLSSTADGFKSLSDVNWSVLSKVGGTVDSMIPGFSKMGMISMQVSPAISSLSSVMSELAEVMESMSSPIDMAAKSLNDMASNTERLKSSVQSIDTSRLTALTGYSDKMVNSQVGRSEVIATNESVEKQVHITHDPIVIKLQMPNGREIQEIIVKDTGHSI